MNLFAMGLITLLIPFSSYADLLPGYSAPTYISCEQVDGAEWYEIGLIPFTSGKGYIIAVIKHDDANQSSRLIMEKPVYETVNNSKGMTFENPRGSIRLAIGYADGRIHNGILSIVEGVPENINVEMSCFKNGRVTYDRIAAPQPRISVGN